MILFCSLSLSEYYHWAVSFKQVRRLTCTILSFLIVTMSFIHEIKTKTFQIQIFFLREIVSFSSSKVFNFRSKNQIFSDLNVWLSIINSSNEILIWEDEEEFHWFYWFCWFLLIMIIKASNLALSLTFQIFSRLIIYRSNSFKLSIMLKIEKHSDCDKKK